MIGFGMVAENSSVRRSGGAASRICSRFSRKPRSDQLEEAKQIEPLRLRGRSVLSQEIRDLPMSLSLGPGERRGPPVIIRKISGRAAGEQELDHVRHLGPSRPREWC